MDFIILAFATYRMGMMLADVEQGGPFGLLHRLRSISGVKYTEHSTPYGTNVVSEAMLCIYCNSVWIGFVFAVLYAILGPLAVIVALPFALSGAAIVIKEFSNDR